MKGKSVCIATSALDRSNISITPRHSWDLITRRLSGTTSNLSSFQSCFRPISPSAGAAMLLRPSGGSIRSWLYIAIGEE